MEGCFQATLLSCLHFVRSKSSSLTLRLRRRTQSPLRKRKKLKCSGVDAIILKETPAPQCLQNSFAFLEKRRMQVPRSSAVLNNSNRTLRLLSLSGLLSRK